MFDPLNYRQQFPLLKHSIQLSSCSQSALHDHVKAAIHAYTLSWEEDGMNWQAWMGAVEQAREKFATLINADSEEVAIVSSVSHAASSIATALNKNIKKEIVITEDDFPSIGHVWLSQKDCDVTFISGDNGIIPLEKYEQAVTDNTLLTSISHVSFYNGFKQDLKKISEIVHRNGSYLFVDAYQSAGQTPIDVKEMNIDFLAAGMQKYLLGIPGIAFLYIKKDIADQMTPRITGWFGQSDPFAFDIKHAHAAQGARRFDTGTFPMINGYAANAAFDLILDIGVGTINEYLTDLSQVAMLYAEELGLIIRSPLDVTNKGSNTAIYVPNASEIEQQMKERGIIVSARNDVIRVAPHFYNTIDDIKTALYTLRQLT